ncbi:MAG TPA: hypothetical protein VKZ87_06660 [Ferrovibrio sp.]|jgi:hypothetical protein|uniref:hypothetical protein n=1 Tax=Ferrovibrio sp. TaxID=1917215 RepID=UPI002B4B66E0|nr:hypothetical protein [Ferrovibrio sp.]HLT77050.1 hypothetical protein [Ferrovibrio sp.]
MGESAASPQNQRPSSPPAEAESATIAPATARELLDFVALVLLAIKEEIQDLQQVQSATSQAFAAKLVELGRQLPGSPVMGEVVTLMQSDDLRSQRQQHVINALKYVEDIIREQSGRSWAPLLTHRAAGWGEGLVASQTLEQVRTHFQHYLLGAPAAESPAAAPAETEDEVELF